MRYRGIGGWGLLTSLMMIFSACGVPNFDATEAQRAADLEWVFATFDRNYAPLAWKKSKLGIDATEVKRICLEKNKTIKTNDEFRALAYWCVNQFQDAHTKAFQMGALYPGKATVAYLGFKTSRSRVMVSKEVDDGMGGKKKLDELRDAISVSGFLATTDEASSPVKTGDIIMAANGKPIWDYIESEIVPFNNLGQNEANRTLAATYFPLRSSLELGMPQSDDITLTIIRGETTFDLTVPWTKQDYYEFSDKQSAAAASKKKTGAREDIEGASYGATDRTSRSKSRDKSDTDGSPTDSTVPEFSNHEFFVGFGFLSQVLKQLPKTEQGMGKALHEYLLRKSFQVFWISPTLKLTAETGTDESPMKDRVLPAGAIPVPNKIFPAFLIPKDGKLIGYVRVSTFSLVSDDLKEFGKVLSAFNTYKVKGVILDLLDNGGGSLIEGLRLANQVTSNAIRFPGMQVALNDNWIDSFQSAAIYAKSDIEKTWAQRIEKILREDQALGQKLSRVINTDQLDPVFTKLPKNGCTTATEDSACLDSSIPVITLVNEMCASMCDIFASVMRDNGVGRLMGVQTMGAGGNVVMHVASPASYVMLQQTESLIVDLQGQYLENQGVVPDIAYDTILDRANKYENTIAAAIKKF